DYTWPNRALKAWRKHLHPPAHAMFTSIRQPGGNQMSAPKTPPQKPKKYVFPIPPPVTRHSDNLDHRLRFYVVPQQPGRAARWIAGGRGHRPTPPEIQADAFHPEGVPDRMAQTRSPPRLAKCLNLGFPSGRTLLPLLHPTRANFHIGGWRIQNPSWTTSRPFCYP